MFNILLTGTAGGMNAALMQLALLGGMIALMYFIIFRPQRKKQKQEEEMRNAISVGDKVMMTSGLVGKIICIKDDEVTIENGLSRTQLTFVKGAVSKVILKNGEEEQTSSVRSIDDKKADLQRQLDERNAAKKAAKEAAKNNKDDKIDLM